MTNTKCLVGESARSGHKFNFFWQTSYTTRRSFGWVCWMGRVKAVLVLAVFSLLVLLNVGPVWALTVAPSPIAGQSFTITNSNSGSGDEITVRSGFGCGNGAPIVGGGFVVASGSLSLTLPAGQYSASGTTNPNPCVNFTVIPAQSIPEYPYGLTLLAAFMVLGYIVIKRKTRQ